MQQEFLIHTSPLWFWASILGNQDNIGIGNKCISLNRSLLFITLRWELVRWRPRLPWVLGNVGEQEILGEQYCLGKRPLNLILGT